MMSMMVWLPCRLLRGAPRTRCAANAARAARSAALLLTLGLAGLAPAGAAAPVPDTLAQRVLACTVCHGKEGVATNAGYFPRIAGKPAGYLYNQLLNFRDGRRNNGAMSLLIRNLSDAYLHEIANHFAALELPYAAPAAGAVAAATLARGAALVHDGDAAREVPACVRCHGAALTGLAPAVPGLLGLSRDYLLGQLGAWRTGQRTAAAPDCMAQISQRLRAEDVAALASYLARQPVPQAAHAASALPQALPLACGSVP